jgi:N-acyl amino acid synthase of PEP-CTERM/exosortase system
MDVPEYTSLSEHFAEYFEIVPANTPALMEEVFKLRYEAFCNERIFDAARYHDGLERDAYDGQAIHTLLYHRPSGNYAGTVRLVLAERDDPDWLFPIERAAGSHIDRPPLTRIPRYSMGEVSRFCLARKFRSRKGGQDWPDGLAESFDGSLNLGERRILPHPVIALIIAAIRMSWEHHITTWYALMEPRLERRLKQFGLVFHPVSDTFHYCGARRAYIAYLPHLLDGVHETHPDVWNLLTEKGTIAFSPDARNQDLIRAADQVRRRMRGP